MKRFRHLLAFTTVIFLIGGCGKPEKPVNQKSKPDVVQSMNIKQSADDSVKPSVAKTEEADE